MLIKQAATTEIKIVRPVGHQDESLACVVAIRMKI